MQQGYRECKVASFIKLQGILPGNRERFFETGYFLLVQQGPRGIEINTLFGATIDPDKGYHPYQSPGRAFCSICTDQARQFAFS